MAKDFTQFVTKTFDFQFGENFSRLQTRSDADVQQTSYITLAYFEHTHGLAHTHTSINAHTQSHTAWHTHNSSYGRDACKVITQAKSR